MPSVEFSVFKTAHFQVIYPAGLDTLARRAAGAGESAFPRICRDLLLNPDETFPAIDLILTDMDDESNGFSSAVGHRIEVFLRPNALSAPGEIPWIERVVVHELAHQLTYFALRRRLKIYGELYQLAFLPAWFLEGFSQYQAESWDAHREFLLQAAFQKGLFLPRDRLYGYTMGHNPVEGRLLYEQGHALYRLMVERSGNEVGGKILKHLTLFRPNFNRALKKVTGLTEKAWMKTLERTLTGNPAVPAQGAPAGRDLGAPWKEKIDQIYTLKKAAGGFFIAGFERVEVYDRNLYFADTAGCLKKIDGPFVSPFFSLSENAQTVYYSKLTRRPDGSLKNALYRWNTVSGAEPFENLLGEDPVMIPGGTLVFIRSQGGCSTLWRYALSDGKTNPMILPAFVSLVYRPVYGNERLYFSFVDTGGGRKIGSCDPAGKDFKVEIEKTGVDCRFPSPSPQGSLFFTSDESGIFNLHVREAGGEIRQVTRHPHGVFAPEVQGDSVLVTAMRDQEKNFGVSVFLVPAIGGDSTNLPATPAAWKSVHPSPVSEAIRPGTGKFTSVLPYSTAGSLRPRIAFPRVEVNTTRLQNSLTGLGIQWSDPLEKWTVVTEAFHYPGLRKTGGSLQMTVDAFAPFLGLGIFQKDVERGISAKISIPLDFSKSPRIDQRLSLGIQGISDEKSRLRVPLIVEYGVGRWDGFFGSAIHPLSTKAFRLAFETSDPAWGGDFSYRALTVHGVAAQELGHSFQTVTANLRIFHLWEGGNTRFSLPNSDLPRGLTPDSTLAPKNYLRPALEYRLPPLRQAGLSFLGVYFEMLTLSLFWDGLLTSTQPFSLQPRTAFDLDWTAGLQFRQRLFWMGKGAAVMGIYFAYLPSSPAAAAAGFALNQAF